ncbi:MAG: threonine/serine exporter family protein [Bacteroidales bacterium]|nr:threonine/serine exporter family protein [Bacteroidales bacterium]
MQSSENRSQISEALEVATKAGYILLENGAEISRVEETMNRIAKYFGVDSGNYFVLSNGIFATGNSRKLKNKNPNSQSEQFADVKYIPIRGSRLDKVVEINQLSRDIEAGKYTIETAEEKLEEINKIPPVKGWFQILSSGIGSGFFCSIFGGGLQDCLVSTIAGLILWIFVLKISGTHISKLFGNMVGSIIATSVCIVSIKLGLGVSLGHTIIGAVIPLVPGVAFTIGIRDIVDEDYLAGTTRLVDASVVFFGIAMGVAVTLIGFSKFLGGLEL